MILVTGGSASGKSAYAEKCIAKKMREGQNTPAADANVLPDDASPTYLATMRGGSAEAEERIRKHRRQREGLGFKTLECPVQIGTVISQCTDIVLLEDLGNLVANEMFGDTFDANVSERIFSELRTLDEHCSFLVIVTDVIFSDGGVYDEQTTQYMKELAGLNRLCAEAAEEMWEVVCGIPVAIQ